MEKKSDNNKIAFFAALALLALLVAGIAIYSGFTSYLDSLQKNSVPIITKTSSGYHYYSKAAGGYSFDYSDNWNLSVGAEVPKNSGDYGKIKLLLNALSTDILYLKNSRANSSVVLTFLPISGGMKSESCNVDNFNEASRAKNSNITFTSANWIVHSSSEGCLVNEIGKDGSPVVFFLPLCNKSTAVFGGESQADVLEIGQTFKCGKQAQN